MPHKILVVDDEPDLQMLIRQKFRSAISSGDLIFDFALNGRLALDKLEADPAFDLVLTDINMPVMDGLELLGEIHKLEYVAKTVVISAYSELKNIRVAMNRGAFDFITKPIEMTDLEVTVKKALAEIDLLKRGKEAAVQLGVVTIEKEEAILEKLEAQRQALESLREKERIVLEQNEILEQQVKTRTAEVVNQKELIEEKNKEILDSIHYARHVQEAMMPSESVLQSMFLESFVLYIPKDIVAGDFYWLETVSGNKIMVAADCTGHGVAGALLSMVGISLLNQVLFEKEISTPAAMLEHLHQMVVTSLKQQEGGSHEGMDISVCSYHEKENRLFYASANRSLVQIRKGSLIEYHGNKFPVGGLQITHHEPFLQHEIIPEPGDAFYIFTDGYADQFGGEAGKKMMTKKFKDLLISLQPLSMREQKKDLLGYFNSWKGEEEQVDDVLVMGFRLIE